MNYKIGLKYSKSFLIDDTAINQFAIASQDNNPVHLDDNFAKNTIFKQRIAHGMLLGGLISSILGNDFPGNGTIYLNQQMSFRKPVFINDTVEVIIEIQEITEKGWLSLSTNCFVNQILVMEGSALVIPPKK
ncbi:MAG: MaoC family dehydratase [Ignavibacteria bacterium]|nr:MaoC family dehydratase [Ignavibacteria bacterium]